MTNDDIRDRIETFVERAYLNLEQVDYYRVLGVSSAAGNEQIRTAYYKLAAYLHPDVHGMDIDPVFRNKLTKVFSRVVEAYKALSDSNKRRIYDSGLAGGRMRLRSGTTMQPRRRQDSLVNAKAKRFFELSQAAMRDNDLRSARTNMKLALSMEPDSELLQEELAKIEKLSS